LNFPTVRMRRLRRTAALRDMLNQVNVQPSQLIYPIFVDENIKKPVQIEAMPGYSRLPTNQVVEEGKQALAQGARAWIDEKAIIREILTGIKRAGADLIITYLAKDIKSWLNQP